MSRIHRRGEYRDWSLEAVRPEYYYSLSPSFPVAVRYRLSVSVFSRDEAQQLIDAVTDRCCPSVRTGLGSDIRIEGIEVTEAEARRITNGEDPVEVLLGTFPDCGYRLVAVPDPLLGGG